jgi:outer membrane protein
MDTPFTLRSSIEYAIENNTDMLSAIEEVGAADATKKQAFTEFLPKLTAEYGYRRLDEEKKDFGNIVTRPRDQYQFTGTVEQPIFTGFAILTQYEISTLGLDLAKLAERITRLDLIFEVKRRYFDVLESEKLELVARQQLVQLENQAEVARNFYEVGMSPRNDVLEAEVAVANSQQDLVVRKNEIVLAKSRFNTLLRRPVDAPLALQDILAYEPFEKAYEDCVKTALAQRVEIELADTEVAVAEKDVKLEKADYFPTVGVEGNFYRRGDDARLNGGPGIYDKQEWDVSAIASWTFWEWGKTRYGVREKLKRLSQAKLNRERVEDDVREEVKQAFIVLKAAEKNIMTAEKAVEQAKENFRLFGERFKEQVATNTEVLIAQTLQTETDTKYFVALSAYNVAKAGLHRAMGVEVIDEP